ncbi:ABC transporter substrate-binding protein [Cohnella faecalis]|uniref:ABC transporter substrate-binding protein n=1 Tax=Cohnella faecalis TaxID=2315694 RepID=UPI0036233AF5
MKAREWNWKSAGIAVLAGTLLLAGCGKNDGTKGPEASSPSSSGSVSEPSAALQDVTVVLDWTPNTNHTGLYAAKEKGFWEKRGLKVEIVQPPESGANALVGSGKADFGITAQEDLTLAREQGVPIVSVAAIIQHNTSGFASPADKNIKEPKDFEGKTYGAWGSPAEKAVIESLMQEQKADIGKVNFVDIGTADFLTAVKRDIDFAWIYYGWDGVGAELKGEKLNMVYLSDYSKQLDYYTPVLTSNEDFLKNKPDLAKAFLAGATEGYQFAIDHPDEAADILLKAAPELDKDLVHASQKWLASKYKDDAPRWGEQKKEVWTGYGEWMKAHGLLQKELNFEQMYTNDFLPQ